MSWLPTDPRTLDAAAERQGRDAIRRATGRRGASAALMARRGASSTSPRDQASRQQAYVNAAAIVFDSSTDPAAAAGLPARKAPAMPRGDVPRGAAAPAAQGGAAAGPPPIALRLRQYRHAMRELAGAFPDDPVGTVLFARATLALSTAPDDDFQREAEQIVERRFGPTPEPLGAALTLLLARDRPIGSASARPAAEAVAARALLPLARHLPARTFARVGEWAAAEASSETAITLAGSLASPELVYGPGGREAAVEWLFDAYLQAGRIARADALLTDVLRALDAGPDARIADPAVRESLRAALVRMQVRRILARGDWAAGRALVIPDADPNPVLTGASAASAFVRAYAISRAAWPGATPVILEEAARLSDRLGMPPFSAWSAEAELLRVIVRAAMASAQDEHHELELLVSHALALEETLLRSGVVAFPLAPANELAGDLFLQTRRFEQARQCYRDALMQFPKRPRALFGLARASARLEDHAAATAAYRDFLALWARADPNLPEMAEARAWIEKENGARSASPDDGIRAVGQPAAHVARGGRQEARLR